MDYKREYDRWMSSVCDQDLVDELGSMDETAMEVSFFRGLVLGISGLRGKIDTGINLMNFYVVEKVSQGLPCYLLALSFDPSVVIGYGSHIKSDVFARVAALVALFFTADGITIPLWPDFLPGSNNFLCRPISLRFCRGHDHSLPLPFQILWV